LPNLLPLCTCCVCLELRPLPSTGVTQSQKYYGPIRHPKMPGLSVTGVQLVVPDPHQGASRVARAFLVYMLPPVPRCSDCVRICSVHTVVSVFPESRFRSSCTLTFSRIAQRSLTLRPAHSRCHRISWQLLPEGFKHFVTSIASPVATGWSCGQVGLTPTGKRRLCTAHRDSSRSRPERNLIRFLQSGHNQCWFNFIAFQSPNLERVIPIEFGEFPIQQTFSVKANRC
jgi:hypothetical protein